MYANARSSWIRSGSWPTRSGSTTSWAAIEGSSENVAGGFYWSSGREILIRGIVRPSTIEDIAVTVVTTRDGVPVLIEDIAEVRIGPKITYGTGSVNGEPAVILSIQKQAGANTLELTQRVEAELDRIEAELPEGITFERNIFRQADFISLAVDNVILALRDGAFFVIAILLLFLWNVRTTLISIVAIPLSLALAIIAMRALGGTVNTMTLGGMAIAIGALVDDAIIFVENVHRRLRDNLRRPPGERIATLPLIRGAASEIRDPHPERDPDHHHRLRSPVSSLPGSRAACSSRSAWPISSASCRRSSLR